MIYLAWYSQTRTRENKFGSRLSTEQVSKSTRLTARDKKAHAAVRLEAIVKKIVSKVNSVKRFLYFFSTPSVVDVIRSRFSRPPARGAGSQEHRESTDRKHRTDIRTPRR